LQRGHDGVFIEFGGCGMVFIYQTLDIYLKKDEVTLWYNAYNNNKIFPESDRIWLNNMRQNHDVIKYFESEYLLDK